MRELALQTRKTSTPKLIECMGLRSGVLSDHRSGRRLSGFVLLEFAVEGGLSDAEQPRGGKFVSGSFPQSTENCTALQRFKRQKFVDVGKFFRRGVLQVGRQIA